MKSKNLVSVSGAIGSGKDTVGKIIQYLCCGVDKANITYNNLVLTSIFKFLYLLLKLKHEYYERTMERYTWI
jgi:hypothetical protein